jgi:hypothetical protein
MHDMSRLPGWHIKLKRVCCSVSVCMCSCPSRMASRTFEASDQRDVCQHHQIYDDIELLYENTESCYC